MRRVDCRRCEAVVVEEVPWGDGKHTLTNAYMLFLARWARRLSWKETAEAFHTSWEKVFDAVPWLSTARNKYFHLPGNPNKRLVHVPSGRFSLNLAVQPPINLGGRKPEPNARSKCGQRPDPAPPQVVSAQSENWRSVISGSTWPGVYG